MDDKDISGEWVDLYILGTISGFVHEDIFDQVLNDLGLTTNWECFPQMVVREFASNTIGVSFFFMNDYSPS